ncbi:MAG: ABC transporter permease, partial [Akkermansia sp.]|nr:ABC transporter permease [Akkermansia sp.]
MIKLLLRRLGQGVLVIFVLETITFFLVRMLPGNPFLGERKLPQHIMEQLNSLYGLNEGALVQYYNYWKGILLHGDFGPSLVREGLQVTEIIAESFPVSLALGVVGMLIAICIGIPAGMLSACYRNRLP